MKIIIDPIGILKFAKASGMTPEDAFYHVHDTPWADFLKIWETL